MNKNLFFSIVIPTYNRASFIKSTIDSVLNQVYQNFEIIIVDDGSTDNTEEVIRTIPSEKIRYFKVENSERAAARNFGILQSNGEYLTFLDSDDILFPDYLQNANNSILKYKRCPFFHLGYEIRNYKGKILYQFNKIKSEDLDFIVKGNPLSCMGVFIRRDVSEKFKFNEDRELSGSEDWELWLRIIANFGIKTDNRISACLIQHDDRSVLKFDELQLFKRKELALKYAFEDKAVQNLYGKQYQKIDSFADGYISLHLALAGHNTKSLKYLFKSIKNYPLSIFSKRFLAIFKHIVLNIILFNKKTT
ncbi:MAG: glycosyltransferase [Bacteroidota bacterium]